MSQFKASIGLAILLGIGSTQSLAALPGVAAVTGKDPAAVEKAEPLVQGGLLGAISSSIDDVQEKLDINEHLVEAWRERADRAADEVDQLVNQPSPRSTWSVARDFALLSAAWCAVFAALWLLGGLLARRCAQSRWLRNRERAQGLLGYVLPYSLPAFISLPVTLYCSHFLQPSAGRALALSLAYATSAGIFAASLLLSLVVDGVARSATITTAFGLIPSGGIGLVIDSYGMLAIAKDQDSAARDVGLGVGDQVVLRAGEASQVSTAVLIGKKNASK